MSIIDASRTPAWKIVFAWAIVLMPFVWGCHIYLYREVRFELTLALATPHDVVEV